MSLAETCQKYVFDLLKADAIFSQIGVFIENRDENESPTNAFNGIVADAIAQDGAVAVVYLGPYQISGESTAFIKANASIIVKLKRNSQSAASNPYALEIPDLIERFFKIILNAKRDAAGEENGVPKPETLSPGSFALLQNSPISIEENGAGETSSQITIVFALNINSSLSEVRIDS